MSELRHAIRRLIRRPGFTVAVASTLAIGVGATTAIFSAIEAAVLRAPPYPGAEELRLVRPVLSSSTETDTLSHWSYPLFEAFRSGGGEVGDVAAYTPRPGAMNLDADGEPHRVHVEMASPSYLPVLGLRPALGRWFVPEEDRVPGGPAVVVLAHDTWSSNFGGDPAVIGRVIRLNGLELTVVGVAPRGFRGLSERADAWVPMMMAPTLTFPRRLEGPFSFWHAVVVRVPAAGSAALADALAARARAVAEQVPLAQGFGDVELGFWAESLAGSRTQPTVRTALNVLMGAAAFILLIVCVNVGNLLLTQATRRRREFGVRTALGASPHRIAGTVLTESLLLGLLGGAGGLLMATWLLAGVRALAPAAPAGTADPATAALGGSVLLFNFGLALAAGLAAGLLPALRARRAGVRGIIHGDDRGAGGGRGRGGVIAAEVALALVLLTGAGLMLRTFQTLRTVEAGFEPRGLLTASVELPRQMYDAEEVVPFLNAVSERLGTLPGASAATVANCLPLAGGCDQVGLRIEGRPSGDAPPAPVAMNMVGSDYFRTMGIPLLGGRGFAGSDRSEQPRVAIVTRTAAERFWPGQDPVGARIQLTVGWDDYAEVVGVVDDVRQSGLDEPPEPMVYLPYAQWSYRTNRLVVRTAGEPLVLAAGLRSAVGEVEPGLPVWDVQTMEERVRASIADTRFTTLLLTIAAAIATLLAALGVFSVMTFSVAGRTREMGLRMALGARRFDVVGMVLGHSMRWAALGLVGGLIGAALLTRVLESQLHGVSATDPVTFLAGTAVMAVAAWGAALIPARRATRIAPMEVLRHE